MSRIHCPQVLIAGLEIVLPAAAARHVQVLRMQPGSQLTLFNGLGGQWQAQVTYMGRSEVRVRPLTYEAIECESVREIHLAVGMPANERMEWLVEKATELGVTSIAPLMTERSVLRLSGERADKKVAHWRAVAVAACEQCGRNRVPMVHAVRTLDAFIKQPAAQVQRLVLSPREGPVTLTQLHSASAPLLALSGPEGGLTTGEEAALATAGYESVRLGARVLRAETAPIALLAALSLEIT